MQKIALFMIPFLAIACATQSMPTITLHASSEDEAQIRSSIEGFGWVLQEVSLLAPDAADRMREKYAEFTSPDLLDAWIAEPTAAPGRLTSSPWPDRIEFESIQAQGSGQYLVAGSVIEITSQELGTDQFAAQYPVEITISLINGRWQIAGWVAGDWQKP